MRTANLPPSRSYPLAVAARLGLAGALLAGALTGAPPARAASATLHILHTTPMGGATDIPASGFISIAFDRPVVRLGEVGVAGSHPAATIAPAIKGQGRWINSSIWAYQVPGGLSLATHYTVTTRPDLVAADGSRLAGATSFGFETLRPGVLSVTPPSGTRYALRRDSGADNLQPARGPSQRRAGLPAAGERGAGARPLQLGLDPDRHPAERLQRGGTTRTGRIRAGRGPSAPARQRYAAHLPPARAAAARCRRAGRPGRRDPRPAGAAGDGRTLHLALQRGRAAVGAREHPERWGQLG